MTNEREPKNWTIPVAQPAFSFQKKAEAVEFQFIEGESPTGQQVYALVTPVSPQGYFFRSAAGAIELSQSDADALNSAFGAALSDRALDAIEIAMDRFVNSIAVAHQLPTFQDLRVEFERAVSALELMKSIFSNENDRTLFNGVLGAAANVRAQIAWDVEKRFDLEWVEQAADACRRALDQLGPKKGRPPEVILKLYLSAIVSIIKEEAGEMPLPSNSIRDGFEGALPKHFMLVEAILKLTITRGKKLMEEYGLNSEEQRGAIERLISLCAKEQGTLLENLRPKNIEQIRVQDILLTVNAFVVDGVAPGRKVSDLMHEMGKRPILMTAGGRRHREKP